MKNVILLIFISVSLLSSQKGMMSVKSHYGVNKTTINLVNLLRDKGITIFKVIDHASGAKQAGLSLRPTKLVIFGNPKIGTPLMQCSQTLGLDLPQKMLIYEDDKQNVYLVYNTPVYLMWRHGIDTKCALPLQKKMGVIMRMFADTAAGNDHNTSSSK